MAVKLAVKGLNLRKTKADKPRLVDYGGDISKNWYIIFYVENEDGQRIRKRYSQINHLANAEARYRLAKEVMADISSLIRSGAKAESKQQPQKAKALTLLQAMDVVIAYKSITVKPVSVKPYRTVLKYLQRFTRPGKKASEFTEADAMAFFNDVKKTGIANKTFNSYVNTLRTAFEHLQKTGVVRKNPIKEVPTLQVTKGQHFPFTKQQLETIKTYLMANADRQFYLFVQFLYYTCARPIEVCGLKIADIKADRIHFRSVNAKTKRSGYVLIPPSFNVVIDAFGLRSLPANYYVFSPIGKPGPQRVGQKYFYKRQVQLLQALGFNDAPYTLYSYKHTAVCQMYLAGIDIKSIQMQCRHADIKQTDIYLKDLGLIRNDEVMNRFPDF